MLLFVDVISEPTLPHGVFLAIFHHVNIAFGYYVRLLLCGTAASLTHTIGIFSHLTVTFRDR